MLENKYVLSLILSLIVSVSFSQSDKELKKMKVSELYSLYAINRQKITEIKLKTRENNLLHGEIFDLHPHLTKMSELNKNLEDKQEILKTEIEQIKNNIKNLEAEKKQSNNTFTELLNIGLIDTLKYEDLKLKKEYYFSHGFHSVVSEYISEDGDSDGDEIVFKGEPEFNNQRFIDKLIYISETIVELYFSDGTKETFISTPNTNDIYDSDSYNSKSFFLKSKEGVVHKISFENTIIGIRCVYKNKRSYIKSSL
tara:strand:+ start:1545 stop:2306 length:762 start_codon:yes stop_codon:yes gene_type:complete